MAPAAKKPTPKKPKKVPWGNWTRPTMAEGRPPLPIGSRAAFMLLSNEAVEVLFDIIQNPSSERREQACEYVINQAHGTARQSVDINNPDGSLAGKHELSVTFSEGGKAKVVRIGTEPAPWDHKPITVEDLRRAAREAEAVVANASPLGPPPPRAPLPDWLPVALRKTEEGEDA